MRSGGCALQQTLTSEAASVLKHSLGLARRRGHAQVTPLHVAATLLSLRASSFRRACLKSHPHHQTSPHSHHPLQCRALELCFNVALNRLPTTPTPNLLHTQQPSLSNALIAALKRAQAHQRRGCIEQQNQQPLLTIKVELEQLVISILDDPSVSRVMREAGFSSTAVKSSIEDSSPPCSVFQCYSSSGGVFSSPCSPSPSETQRETINSNSFRHTHFYTSSDYYNPVLFSPQKRTPVYPITESASSKEDIKLVLDILLRKKKKNTVIVGDSLSITEGLVGELMGRLDRGEVPDELKSTHFIKFQFAPVSLRFMKRDEVEMNLLELKRKVDSVASGGGGAIFYFGDLKWTVEATLFSEKDGGGEVSGYNPVDHVVAEIGKLFSDYGSSSNAKVWLMATASYQTYMRCQMRQPALETQWSLQAVLVPSGGLGLSLHASSVLDSKMTISQNSSHMLEKKLFSNREEQDKLTCCEECASNYEKEAQLFKPGQTKLLPSWLQSHSIEAHQKEELTQLRRKWNRLCHYLHQGKNSQNHWNNILYSNNSSNGKIYPCNSSYPLWPKQGSIFPDSSSISFADSATTKQTHCSNLVPPFRRQQSCTIEFNFSDGTQKQQQATTEEPSLDSLKGMEGKEEKITLALGNSQFGGPEQEEQKSITHTAQRRAHVCKILQENVPWQSETIPSIAEALIDSKSEKPTTWLILQGNDSVGKRRLAHAIAESFFGSADMLLHLDMKKKDTLAASLSETLAKALKAHEKLVILIENIDLADTHFKKLLADGYETGKFGQSVFIISNGGSTSNNEEKNQDSVMQLTLQVSETNPNSATHCVGQKRKAEFDLFPKIKSPRMEEKEGESNRKRDFSRQSSFNTLDLNIRADEQEAAEDDDDCEGESSSSSSPISSDLTRETLSDPINPNGFLDSIEKRFELNRSPARDREMAELFTSKIKGSFEEIKRKKNLGKLNVEEKVIEEVIGGCGGFTNSVFEKWLKDIFQRSLEKVNIVGKEEGIGFRLCWGGIYKGKGKGKQGIGGEIRVLDSEEGFMSSCLPKNIQVNYYMD